MKKIGIFYGSTTGVTESIAEQIAGNLQVASSDVYNVADASASSVQGYDLLILGSSTWGAGDLQDDWYDFLDALEKESLEGKEIAIFGTGDGSSFSDTFCDAIGTIYEKLQGKGATFIGSVDAAGYSYSSSTAEVVTGEFVGLAIDDVNEGNLNSERIDAWTAKL